MKILAPASSPDEVEMLVENGADEIYCGLVPPDWLDTYSGAIWMNRRSPRGASLATYEALGELVGRAHGFRVPVYLTLNAPSYNEPQLELLARLATRAADESGIDAFIVSDLALLLTLVELRLKAKIHVSSVASALNSDAIAFYRDLGASRIILPRALSVREIGGLATAAAGSVELEAFILNDGCAFEEGLCHTTHHHRVGAFCTNIPLWTHETDRLDGQPLAADERARLDEHLTRYREWIWYLNGCGCSMSDEGLPYGPCGLCAISELQRIGVASLKVVGREASAFRKLMSVRLVKAVVSVAATGAPAAEVAARAKEIRNMPERCASGYMCYYRG